MSSIDGPKEFREIKLEVKSTLYCDLSDLRDKHNRKARRTGGDKITLKSIAAEALTDWREKKRLEAEEEKKA